MNVPVIEASEVVQSVVYSASYKESAAKTADAFTVDAIVVVLNSGIAGFIVDTGVAVEDAVVTINGESATTNADGYYKITNIAPGTYDVAITAEGYADVEVTDVVVADDKLSTVGRDINASALVKASITVTGIVVDKTTDNAVAANLTLEYNDPADGWVEIATDTATAGAISIDQTDANPDMEFGGEYRLTVSYGIADDLYGAFQDEVITFNTKADAEANALDGIEMTPVAAMTISGVLNDSTDAAIASTLGAVELQDLEGNVLESADTEADGKFTFTDVTLPTGDYVLFVNQGTDAVYTETISVAEGNDLTKNITLVAGYDVNFTLGTEEVGGVFSSSGSDADTATYTATLMKGNTAVGSDPIEAAAGDDDSLAFTITRVAPGSYTLVVSGDYLITESFNITVVDANVTASGRTAPAGAIGGTIDDGVAGVVGATVELLDADGNLVDTVESIALGAYRFGGLAEGNYTIRVTADTFEVFESDPIAVLVDSDSVDADKDATLAAIPTTGDVAGFVRTTGTLAAAQGAVVTYYALSVEGSEIGDFVDEATVAADGSYAITTLVPGSYTVIVRDPGSHEIYKTTQVIAAGDDITNANYRLTAGGNATLDITIVDANGDALELDAAADLSLIDSYDDTNDATDDSESIFQDLAAVDLSTFALTDLSAGTYTLDITAPAGYVFAGKTVTIAKGEAAELEITLLDAADVHNVNFRILNQDGTDANADASVVVFDADGSVLTSDATDANGNAQLASMLDGTYTYYVFKNGNIVYTGTVKVAGANVNVPVIQLDTYAD